MTDYTNGFGASTKDSTNAIILASEIGAEFDLIVTHIATKSNKISGATVDRIITMTSGGDLKNSGKLITDKADVAGDTYTGIIDQNDATASTSGGTGSIHTDGGVGAVKDIVSDMNFKPLGDTSASDPAAFGYHADNGAIVAGQGNNNDVVLKNDTGGIALRVPTGTQNVVVEGTTTLEGLTTVGGDIFTDTDGADDIGETATRFQTGYFDTLDAAVIVAPAMGVVKVKTADTSRTTSATLAADNHLTGWTIAADTLYSIEGIVIPHSESVSPDYKWAMRTDNAPEATSFWAGRMAHEITTGLNRVSDDFQTDSHSHALEGSGTFGALHVYGFIKGHATLSATLEFFWAQGTSNATATTMRLGSWIKVTPIVAT